MAASISHQHYNVLMRYYTEAFSELYNQLSQQPYKADKTDFYKYDFLERFLDEFKDVVVSNLKHKASLKAYIEEVYYNGIGYLLVRFKMLQSKRLLQLQDDWGEAAKDDVFTKIYNGYTYSLSMAASEILNTAKKFGIIELRIARDLKREDYNISGKYVPLLKSEGVTRIGSGENLSNNADKNNIDDNKDVSFKDFLLLENEEEKEKLLNFLIAWFTNSRPKNIFLLLCALSDLEFIKKTFITNQTALHTALVNTFGAIGSRQAYTSWFSKLQEGTRLGEEEKIKAYKRKIAANLGAA